jgi:uncharacterized protein YdhG (YjbR/CyaY superfamily)
LRMLICYNGLIRRIIAMTAQKPATIDEYITRFSDDVQQKLQTIRQTIQKAAPEATEKMSWQMPTFYLFGNVIHFAAFARHIGIYPGAEGIEKFAQEFERLGLHYSKGAVQLPLDRELPLDLIERITAYRVSVNLADRR